MVNQDISELRVFVHHRPMMPSFKNVRPCTFLNYGAVQKLQFLDSFLKLICDV